MIDAQLGKMLEIAIDQGLDDLEIRMEVHLVLGSEKAKLFTLQTAPELFPAMIKGMNEKMDAIATLRAELQKVLDAEK